MTEEQKQKVINSIKEQLPAASDERIESILAIVILEIESYNNCGNTIEWEKLLEVITEVLYQSLKIESDVTVSSVRRGDTTISYASKSSQVQNLLSGYKDLIKRVIGCSEVTFY